MNEDPTRNIYARYCSYLFESDLNLIALSKSEITQFTGDVDRARRPATANFLNGLNGIHAIVVRHNISYDKVVFNLYIIRYNRDTLLYITRLIINIRLEILFMRLIMVEYHLYNATDKIYDEVNWSRPISSHKSINAARKAAKQFVGKSDKKMIAVATAPGKPIGVLTYSDGKKWFKGERAKIHTGWYYNSFRKPQIASGYVKTDGSVEERIDPYVKG